MRRIFVVVCSLAFVACQGKAGSDPSGGDGEARQSAGVKTAAPAAPAASEASCDAVVAKLMSANPGSGDAEKKLFTKMCAEMTPTVRGCIVAAKSNPERDACVKDMKLK